MSVILRPGPQLIERKWIEGDWVEKDVTDRWVTYLFYPECTIEGATLADCLRLLKSNMSFSIVVFNNWVEEFIEEGLNSTESDEDLISLELYVADELEDGKLQGLTFPSVHAPARGENFEYSIMFTPASKLAHLPITIGGYSIWNTSQRPYGAYIEADTFNVSLGQILYALIWELSFCGPPKVRDEKTKKLDEAYEEMVNE